MLVPGDFSWAEDMVADRLQKLGYGVQRLRNEMLPRGYSFDAMRIRACPDIRVVSIPNPTLFSSANKTFFVEAKACTWDDNPNRNLVLEATQLGFVSRCRQYQPTLYAVARRSGSIFVAWADAIVSSMDGPIHLPRDCEERGSQKKYLMRLWGNRFRIEDYEEVRGGGAASGDPYFFVRRAQVEAWPQIEDLARLDSL